MNKVLYFLLLTFSILSYAKVQCLDPKDTISGHCKEVSNSKIKCQSGTKVYDCKNIATKCSKYTFESQSFGFQKFQPARQVIDRVSFPRNDRYIYRGIPYYVDQITEQKFIASVFGDDLLSVGTVYQWRTSQYLEGKIDESHFIRDEPKKGMRKTRVSGMIKNMKLKEEFRTLKSCHSQFSHRDAQRYASDLMIKSFKELDKRGLIKRYFLKSNYNSGSDYRTYGNWGEYLIFGSVYSNIASWLSGKMIMYNNSKNRSMDLNYYNHTIGEKWVYDDGDNGEMVTPAALTVDELEGLIISDSSAKSGSKFRPSTIDHAFLKYKKDNKNYILVIDGDYNTCLTKDSKGIPYFCDQYFKRHGITVDNPRKNSRGLIFGPPTLLKKAPVIAIISKKLPLAKDNDVSHLFEKFKISKRRLNREFKNKIKNIKFFNGDTIMKAQLSFPKKKVKKTSKPTKGPESKKEIEEDKKEVKKIYIISAHFGRGHEGFSENNLLSYVINFCKDKVKCDYGVRPGRFFPKLVKQYKSAELEVTYRCLKDENSEKYTVRKEAGNIMNLSCAD